MAESSEQVVIPKVWRSELIALFVTVASTIGAVILSKIYPASVITGPLFSWSDTEVLLRLPLFWLVPFSALTYAIYRMYNVRFLYDERGIECRVGILSLSLNIMRIGFEDIRSIEVKQSIIERILNVGSVSIGTAATGDVEVIFQGIDSPKVVQDLLRNERDRRQKAAGGRQSSTEVERAPIRLVP